MYFSRRVITRMWIVCTKHKFEFWGSQRCGIDACVCVCYHLVTPACRRESEPFRRSVLPVTRKKVFRRSRVINGRTNGFAVDGAEPLKTRHFGKNRASVGGIYQLVHSCVRRRNAPPHSGGRNSWSISKTPERPSFGLVSRKRLRVSGMRTAAGTTT